VDSGLVRAVTPAARAAWSAATTGSAGSAGVNGVHRVHQGRGRFADPRCGDESLATHTVVLVVPLSVSVAVSAVTASAVEASCVFTVLHGDVTAAAARVSRPLSARRIRVLPTAG